MRERKAERLAKDGERKIKAQYYLRRKINAAKREEERVNKLKIPQAMIDDWVLINPNTRSIASFFNITEESAYDLMYRCGVKPRGVGIDDRAAIDRLKGFTKAEEAYRGRKYG